MPHKVFVFIIGYLIFYLLPISALSSHQSMWYYLILSKEKKRNSVVFALISNSVFSTGHMGLLRATRHIQPIKFQGPRVTSLTGWISVEDRRTLDLGEHVIRKV